MCSGSEAGSYRLCVSPNSRLEGNKEEEGSARKDLGFGLRVQRVRIRVSRFERRERERKGREGGRERGRVEERKIEGEREQDRDRDSCITQLKAQGPSRNCNESKEEEEKERPGREPPHTRRKREPASSNHAAARARAPAVRREIDNLLVRVHFIIEMIRWTGLAPWKFEFPFPGSLTSTFLWFHGIS